MLVQVQVPGNAIRPTTDDIHWFVVAEMFIHDDIFVQRILARSLADIVVILEPFVLVPLQPNRIAALHAVFVRIGNSRGATIDQIRDIISRCWKRGVYEIIDNLPTETHQLKLTKGVHSRRAQLTLVVGPLR